MGTVSGAPYYSYLNQLLGTADTVTTSSASGASTATATTTTTTPTTTAATDTTASSLVSSLLGGSSGGGFSSEILSLLQENSTGSFDPITSLLGGASTNDALTSVFANLYASVSAASLTTAQDNGTTNASNTATTATASPVQNLVNASIQATEAYNQTVLQNAQTVIDNNSYEADGVTPLVA